MSHKSWSLGLGALLAVAACVRSPRVETTSGGEVMASTVPSTSRTLPTGATLDVRLDQQLGTESSRVGDTFSATVSNAVIASNGSTAVPAGARVWGHVSAVKSASNATEQAAIILDFDSLTFNGNRYPFEANITATNLQKEGASTSETVKNAAIGAAAGAVLGAILGGADKDKILLGAGLGAVAGTAISLGQGTNGVLPAGSHMTIQTTQSVALR